MEGNAYGYPSTQTNLASGSYPSHIIDPCMLSMDFVPSQNMDTGFQASQTNVPMEIAQPDVHTRNNPSAGDGTPPPAKKRRGRPLGSKNKVRVDAALHGPEQPKPQRKAGFSKQKAKSSPQIAPNAQGAGTSQPSIARKQDNANQSPHLTVDQANSGLPSQAEAATPIPTEGAMEIVISPIEPIRAFNIANRLQHPTSSHRKDCPCHGCDNNRPHEAKRTRSGAPFDLFASIVGDAAAAVYKRNEEFSHYMGEHAKSSPAEFKAKQLEFVKDSLDDEENPLMDRRKNRVRSIPSRSTIKEHALGMMKQKLQELERRNKTFTADPPCVKEGTFDVQHYIKYEVERGRNVVDDPK
ncbi:hypothetical protein JMJ35_005978 [Cladonia borealis]|uniref:Uncharacterized protein n=1 Tax=Cladonia borealis TaxID=184061 RepID=A0AA39QYA6_9LECA|nr:hypothetical protein JMJ35_005978 [Cladonia borealis]